MLFEKERLQANRSRHALQKSYREWIALVALYKRATRVMHLWFALLLSKNKRLAEKKLYFSPCFWQFCTTFSLLCPRVSDKSDSLLSLFTKELLWAICSCSSLQKSDGSESPFSKSESLFRSFAHKKGAIRLKNLRTNSQSCTSPVYFSCNVKTKTYIEERTEIFNSRDTAFTRESVTTPFKEADTDTEEERRRGFGRPKPPSGR